MVCKEELCTWFKNLSPHKRIDFMCGLLNMCHPMELRFLGSFIEDLAKKDFLHLRESEGKANSRHELSNLALVDENLFRTKMAVFLGLLHSSNRHCSTIIFNLIDSHVTQAFTVRDNMDSMAIHNILLVLSMGMYHPAFSHNQRTKMYEHYKAACDAAERLSQMEAEEFPRLILSESCETRLCDMAVSPTSSPHVQNTGPQQTQKVYVCDVEVKGCRQRQYHDQKLIEYRIQVTWSNGERKEVYKTVQELLDFHGKLMQSFPDDLSFLKQEKKFPMIHGFNNHIEENKGQINIYTRYLSQLPQHIRQCNHMISFFENGTPVPIPERPSRSSQDAATSPCLQPQLPDLPTYSQLPIPDMPVVGQLSPGQHDLPFNSHSPSLSGKTSSPLINSPCQSPESCLNDSPVNSRPDSPMLSGLKPEDIEKLNLQKNSDIKLKNILNAREKGVPLQNGLIDTRLLMDSPPPPPTHHPYLPSQPGPPLSYPAHLGPPHLYPIFSHYQPPHLSPRMRDMSPTNSECSSPSPSPMPMPRSPHMMQQIRPHLATQQTDSSSEDSDKGRHQFHNKPNAKYKNHYSTSKVHLDDGRRRSEQREASNAGTPPLPRDGNPENGTPGYGSSGYTSDPTYNARQQMPGMWHKAQPAHTSIGVRPKNASLINMPELYPKPGEMPIPMAIPQNLRDYQLAAAANPGLEHLAQRPFMIHPGFLNRPPLMNGNRPMYMNAPSSHNVNNSVQTQPSTSMANMSPYQGQGAGILPSPNMNGTPQQNRMVNGLDSKNGVDLSVGQRPGGLVPSLSASSGATTTMSTASLASQPTPTVATTQHSCTSCGCPGHSNPATYPYQVPQMPPQNLWHVPFSNGLLPIHLQHPFLPHHPFAPNGLNQDVMFPTPYGLSHLAQPGVANGIPNLVYGYNLANLYQNAANSRKSKKMTNCHNCGSSKHAAQDCTENSMETMSGHFHYSYVPKTDSE